MEHLGSAYGVIINDPELRRGQVAAAERAEGSARHARVDAAKLRVRLANLLRAVAVRLEPRVVVGGETKSSQPVFAD